MGDEEEEVAEGEDGAGEEVDPGETESIPEPSCGDGAAEPGSGSAESGDSGCGEIAEAPPAEDAPHAVPREERSAIVFDDDSEDDIRGWPRRMCVRVSGETRTHGLWFPEARRAARFHELTEDDIHSYERAVGRRHTGNSSTWGEKLTIDLPVSEVSPAADGTQVISFRPDGPRYSFDVYGLQARPAWRIPLERTLMLLPISLLRASGLKSVCIDIRHHSTDGYVVDGGGNLPFSEEGHARRRAGAETDEDRASARPAVFVAFAAVNRPWWRDTASGSPVATEAEMDEVYDGRGASAVWFDTVWHEHGHHLQRHWGEPPTPEQDRALQSGIWGDYFRAIPYGGHTRNAIEGFAEACRYVFNGEGLRCRGYRGSAELITDMEAAFATIGVPTVESVRAAQAQILASQGMG